MQRSPVVFWTAIDLKVSVLAQKDTEIYALILIEVKHIILMFHFATSLSGVL